jgi:ATF/CREB family transcription factor
MFPVPSPNSQLFSLATATATATPNTIDFHRTAVSAAAAKAQSQSHQPPAVTSQPQETTNGPVLAKVETKPVSGPYDPHDNDAANGLFLLAQGRNGVQPTVQQLPAVPVAPIHAHPATVAPGIHTNTSPQMNGNGTLRDNSLRGISEARSAGSVESEQARPNTRGKGKRGSAGGATTNGRRKADDAPVRAPAPKKSKTSGALSMDEHDMDDMDDDDDDDLNMKHEDGGGKSKMTEDEKRKNFLERNRYVFC